MGAATCQLVQRLTDAGVQLKLLHEQQQAAGQADGQS